MIMKREPSIRTFFLPKIE